MARINIEDSLFRDSRFLRLITKTGSHHTALGMLVEAFIVAQEFFLKNETQNMIPLTEWNKRGLSDLIIEVGLAETIDGCVYVSGTREQFAWLKQRSEAGKKKRLKKSSKTSNRIKQQKTVERELTGVNGIERELTELNGGEPLTLTLTLSPSLSPTQTQTLTQTDLILTEGAKKLPPSVTAWDVYSQSFFDRYGVEPIRNARVNAQLAQIKKRLGADTGEVIKFFISHNDQFYLKAQHTAGLLLRDCESLHTQWKRGVAVNTGQARRAEEIDTINKMVEGARDYFNQQELNKKND